MARRKKSRRTHTRRRRSMGAIGGGTTNILGIVAGAVIAKVLSNRFSNVNSKILAGGQIAAGILLPKFVKNKFMGSVGTGMVVNGAITGLQSFGVISAINGMVGADEVEFEYMDNVSGTDELQALAGYTDTGIMTGTDALDSIAAMDMEEAAENEDY